MMSSKGEVRGSLCAPLPRHGTIALPQPHLWPYCDGIHGRGLLPLTGQEKLFIYPLPFFSVALNGKGEGARELSESHLFSAGRPSRMGRWGSNGAVTQHHFLASLIYGSGIGLAASHKPEKWLALFSA